ncbi:MAG: YqcC family protein, partial [Gemmatimonadetes bacterium]|nr:YqcC family protein [Gemmatimonadota bacterium]
FWSHTPPDLQREIREGGLQSYLDAPTFELWLQCVFIPNARSAAETNDLPPHSQVGEMARRQYDFHSSVPEAQPLMELLCRFDDLIAAGDL